MMTPFIELHTLSKTQCSVPIFGELAYATEDNFLGRSVNGYDKEGRHLFLLTPKAALALCRVQNDLIPLGFSLFIFDAFRPLRAVQDFACWFHSPLVSPLEHTRKMIHYPSFHKNELEQLGYVAGKVSRHCFGHTVDLGLRSLEQGVLIEMGGIFDYFDPSSASTAPMSQIGERAWNHRRLLRNAMEKQGFIPFDKEYWHFEYKIQELFEPQDFIINSHWESC